MIDYEFSVVKTVYKDADVEIERIAQSLEDSMEGKIVNSVELTAITCLFFGFNEIPCVSYVSHSKDEDGNYHIQITFNDASYVTLNINICGKNLVPNMFNQILSELSESKLVHVIGGNDNEKK